MRQELKEIMRSDIALFAEKIQAFEAGQLDKKIERRSCKAEL